MHFKKLDIFGFKSFADKTKLHFKTGVSAIVGPNGVGKSNILEAIRWVLGEQSARNLRVSKMEDVIFNGTSTRKPLGLAEVSLTLSNSQKILPLDYEEVAIKRKAFRSGESEYFLNRTPCRLKDISSLFLNTGMSNNAYSLVDQRNINLLLSSRPEEKREIFEQVAGIGLYRQKKKEALKRLEQTEANLVRVSDIISELEEQKNILNREANKAKQYQEKLERLKEMEIKFYAFQYKEMREKKDLISKEREKVKGQKQKINQRLAEIEEKFKGWNKQLDLLEGKVSSIYEQKLKIERLKERGNNQLIFNQEQQKQIEKEIKKIDSELIHIESRIIELDKDLKKKNVLIEQLRKKKESLANLVRKEEVLTAPLLNEHYEHSFSAHGEARFSKGVSLPQAGAHSLLDSILKEVDMVGKELNAVAELSLLKRKLNEYLEQLKNKIKQLFLSLIKEKEIKSDAKLNSLEEKEKLEIEMSQMLREALAEARKEKEEKAKQIKQLIKKKGLLEKGIGELKNEQKKLLSQKEKVEKELIKLRDEKQELSGRISQERDKEEEVKRRFFFFAERIQKLELEERGFVLEMRNIQQKMEEKYSLDIGEVMPQKIDVEETRRKIDRLTRRLEGLGSVHLSAIEEEKHLSERFSFLVRQREDLRAAKSSIQKAIIKLDNQAKEMFIEALDKVEKEFDYFFNLLFLGGEARIKREGDILNSDIHIIVHPPGKKLQDALLLSSGERALTAIALLFALFKVKPSPFCVLDEVDASLDESNINRFVDILKEFVQKTQFIIITHNKKTISIADIIYGVTMEEKGISKLVSVKMNEEEQDEQG